MLLSKSKPSQLNMTAPQPRAAFYAPFVGASSFPTPLTPPHFLPLSPHPGNRAPPAPARPPLPPPPAGWTRSFHAIPAAYPRQLREAHGPHSRASHPYRDDHSPEAEAALTSEERRARANAEAKRVAEARWGAHEWTVEEGLAAAPEGQFLAVERWRRDVPRGGRTVVCTHANGMQKEVSSSEEEMDSCTLEDQGVADISTGSRYSARSSSAKRVCPTSYSAPTCRSNLPPSYWTTSGCWTT